MEVLSRAEILKYVGSGLELDQTARFNHKGCASTSTSKSLSITRKQDGYVAHCFKCGKSGRASDSAVRSTQNRSKRTESNSDSSKISSKSGRTDRVVPPARATGEIRKFSPRVSSWIRQYLTEEEIKSHGILCDPVHDRIYFPVSPFGFIYRNTKYEPKWYTKTPKCYSGYRASGNVGSGCAVVCEDIVSAIVCSRYVDAYAACGTVIHDPLLAALGRQKYSKIIVFFDDDNAQVQAKQLQAKRRAELICPSVVIARLGTDPKNLPDSELRRVLCAT